MRFRKNKVRLSSPTSIHGLQPDYYSKGGVDCVSYIDKEYIAPSLPTSEEYNLSSLLTAGVPLEPVNPVIIDGVSDSVLEQMSNKIDEFSKKD